MNKFNVGDLVKCVDNEDYEYNFVVGGIYTVLDDHEEREGALMTVEEFPDKDLFRRRLVPATYKEIHQSSGLKVNDWVRVTRAAKSHENGWDNCWTNEMDQSVGKTVRVLEDRQNYGFVLSDTDDFDFPSFVLEKVEEPKVEGIKAEKPVRLDGYKVCLAGRAEDAETLVRLAKLMGFQEPSWVFEAYKGYNIFSINLLDKSRPLLAFAGTTSYIATSETYKELMIAEMVEKLIELKPIKEEIKKPIPSFSMAGSPVNFELDDNNKICEIEADCFTWVVAQDIINLAEYIKEFNQEKD